MIPQDANLRWSLDFAMDTLVSGRRFRILTLLDDFTRECLGLVVDTSLTALRVTQQIALREQCSLRQVNLTISLAFLSPTLVKAAVDGHLPRGVGISTIRDLPELWTAQHRSLGLQA